MNEEKRTPPSARERWARIWPSLLAVVNLSAVGGPAAVASYRHARDVIAQHGDPVMAPWLALTTDGMLLAALVVIWVRRHRGKHVKAGPWAVFWAGMELVALVTPRSGTRNGQARTQHGHRPRAHGGRRAR